MDDKMKSTIALVTGGASGIGKAITKKIIERGGRVVIADFNAEGLKVAAKLGPRARFIRTDVTLENDVKEALDFAKKTFGGVNVVINSAGIAAYEDPYNFDRAEPHSVDTFKKLMDVNAFGTFNVTRLAVGILADNSPDADNQRGLVINLSSILAYDAPGVGIAYAASKAAVSGMVLPLARAFAPKGIRVVAVAPGFVETPMAVNLREDSERHFAPIDTINLTPKRRGTPQDIAHVIQCIIENAFINAEVIRVDGGYRYAAPPLQKK